MRGKKFSRRKKNIRQWETKRKNTFCVNDPLVEYKPASIWLQREQCNLNHVSGTKVSGHQYGILTHNLLSWTLILPFRVSCSALMMSIREFSRECMLKPSNERGRSCEERKGGWASRKKTTTKAFLISLSSAGVSLSSTIEFKLLCFCSSQRTISCWKEVTNERLNRGSRPKYKSNLVLTTHLTPRSCG